MNSAVSLKKVSEKRTKGSRALRTWAKTMESGKILGCTTEESLGIEETVCMKSVVRNWRDPTCHRKVKVIRISESEIVITAGGSRRGS